MQVRNIAGRGGGAGTFICSIFISHHSPSFSNHARFPLAFPSLGDNCHGLENALKLREEATRDVLLCISPPRVAGACGKEVGEARGLVCWKRFRTRPGPKKKKRRKPLARKP